jgi:hypothetical protein
LDGICGVILLKKIRLRLVNGSSAASFLLENGMGSGRDFREMPDLECDLNDGKPVNIQPGAFSPLLEVMNGDFHTLLLTQETYTAYNINDANDKKALSHLAYLTAADLHCGRETGAVALDLWDDASQRWEELPPWPVKDRKIFVIVSNSCWDENEKMPERV